MPGLDLQTHFLEPAPAERAADGLEQIANIDGSMVEG